MNKFIRVTEARDNCVYWINPESIAYFCERTQSRYSSIVFRDDRDSIMVLEDIEQIRLQIDAK